VVEVEDDVIPFNFSLTVDGVAQRHPDSGPYGRAFDDLAPKRAAVLGHPVGHSLSPLLHRAAYQALGLDGWTYNAIDMTVERLPDFMAKLNASWAGLSLTMPLKKAIIPLVDRLHSTVKTTGVANTVLILGSRNGGLGDNGRRYYSYALNTDIYGIQAAIREVIRHGPVENAAILGNGATAISALAALSLDDQEQTGDADDRGVTTRHAEQAGDADNRGVTTRHAEQAGDADNRGVTTRHAAGRNGSAASRGGLSCKDITVYARPQDDPADLLVVADRLGVSVKLRNLDDAAAELPEYDVVISTMPAHAADGIAADLRAAGGLLLDVIYDPRPTDLQAAWSALGGAIVGGERMLLHQAESQVDAFMAGRNDLAESQAVWDGVALRAMDQALQAALAERDGD